MHQISLPRCLIDDLSAMSDFFLVQETKIKNASLQMSKIMAQGKASTPPPEATL